MPRKTAQRDLWSAISCGLLAVPSLFALLTTAIGTSAISNAQTPTVPDSAIQMSAQYGRLVIKSANLIDGTGAPMRGPVDIEISGNKIVNISPSTLSGRSSASGADRIIDAQGKYVIPGLIDVHMHFRGLPKAYVYRLYLANGITSVRNVDGSLDDRTEVPDRLLAEKKLIHDGREVAPKLWVYPFLPPNIKAAEQVPALVKHWHDLGVDGIKLANSAAEYSDLLAAVGTETKRYGMGLAVHIAEDATPGINALIVARDGATTIEHHYGYAETALINNLTIPRLAADYNYSDERERFRNTLGIWLQTDMKKLETETVPELVKLSTHGRFTMVPTMVVYEKQRDYTRASNVPWLSRYALPTALKLWRTPDPNRHGAIFDRWTSNDEAEAAQVYRRWMEFVRLYVGEGGHLAVGADSGGPFQVFGFQTVREMELLLEAGLTPLEVVRAATQEGARVLQEPRMGTLRAGYAADLLIVDENPLDNFKVLMARASSDHNGKAQRRTLIRDVIVDGRVMDPDQLLQDVENIVAQDKGGKLQFRMW